MTLCSVINVLGLNQTALLLFILKERKIDMLTSTEAMDWHIVQFWSTLSALFGIGTIRSAYVSSWNSPTVLLKVCFIT